MLWHIEGVNRTLTYSLCSAIQKLPADHQREHLKLRRACLSVCLFLNSQKTEAILTKLALNLKNFRMTLGRIKNNSSMSC